MTKRKRPSIATLKERERCIEICVEMEMKYHEQYAETNKLAPNSFGCGAAFGSYDVARDIRRAIEGEDE